MRGLVRAAATAAVFAPLLAHAQDDRVAALATESQLAIASPAPRQISPATEPAAAPVALVQARPRVAPGILPVVGAIRVGMAAGPAKFGAADFIAATAPFVGRSLAPDDVQDLLHAVSGIARARGYILAHARIPPQQLAAGVLDVQVTLGGIDKVRLVGNDAPAVRARLEQLIGAPLTRAALERQLTLARDLPGMTIDRPGIAEQDGQTVLTARVQQKRGVLRGGIDNWGNSAVGPVRARVAYDFNGLFGNERLSGTVEANVAAQPAEMAAMSARIAYDLDDHGTRVELTGVYSHTRPGAALAPYALSGEYSALGLEVTRPLVRGFEQSLWLSGGLRLVTLDRWQTGVMTRHDRAVIANLGLNGNMVLAGGRLRGGISVSQLLGALGATNAANPLGSRPGAGSGATFANAWLDWQGKLSGPVSAWLAVNGQVASAPLPVTTQISLGGPMFGRAYEFGERTGDNGLLAMAELRYTLRDRGFGMLRFAQLYGFADVGSVGNIANDFGTGTLASAGAGARLGLTQHWRLGMEAALPVNQPRYDTGDMSPRYRANLGFTF